MDGGVEGVGTTSSDNQIDEICAKIDKTINHAVQQSLAKLKADAGRTKAALAKQIAIGTYVCWWR